MATCYYPNGTPTNVTDYQECPLPAGQAYGMCCATQNRPVADYCQKDEFGDYTGFCLGGSDSYLYRNSCSDPSWGPDCLKLCINGHGDFKYANNNGDMSASDWPITACGDGTYCCGQFSTGTTCCEQRNGYYVFNNTGVKTKPPSSNSTLAAPLPSPRSTVKAGPVVGAAIGGVVIGALMAAIVALLFWRAAKKRQYPSAPAYSVGSNHYGDQKLDPYFPHHREPQHDALVEAPNQQRAYELGNNDEIRK